MEVEINWLGILGAVVVAMVVGTIWYSSALFGKQWRKLEKIDEKKAKANMPMGMIGMLLIAFLVAYTLAQVVYLAANFYTDRSTMDVSLTTAFWMWLGFVLPVVAGNSIFNQRAWKATAIHAGNWLVTLLAMGLVIGS